MKKKIFIVFFFLISINQIPATFLIIALIAAIYGPYYVG